MKYHVRNEHGELVVQSYGELRTLYAQQFISDDDEIRRDGSTSWVKAGQMRDLKAIKPRRFVKGFEFIWLLIGIALLSLVLVLLMKSRFQKMADSPKKDPPAAAPSKP